MQLTLDEAITVQLGLRLAIQRVKEVISPNNLYLTDLPRLESLEVDVTKFINKTLSTSRWDEAPTVGK